MALAAIGNIHFEASDLHRAKERFAAWMKWAEDTGNEAERASALGRLGNTNSYLGDFPGSLACFREAFSVQTRLGDQNGQAISLTDIARVELLIGQTDSALNNFEEALTLSRLVGNERNIATVLSNLGILFTDFGDREKALSSLEEAMAIRRRRKDRRAEAYCFNSLGYLHWRTEFYSQALTCYKSGLKLALSVGERRLQAGIYNNLGRLYSSMEDYTTALTEYQRASDVARRIGEKRVEAVSTLNVGRAYLESGDIEKARNYFRAGLEEVRDLGDRSMQVVGLHGLAECAYRQQRLSEAREHLEGALIIVEAVRTEIASHALRETFSAAARQFYSLYTEVLLTIALQSHEGPPQELAFQINERIKARSLVEMLWEAMHNPPEIDTPWALRESALRARLEEIKERHLRLSFDRSSGQYRTSLSELVSAEREYDQVVQRLRKNSLHGSSLSRPEPLSSDSVRTAILDEDTTFLNFVLGSAASYVWVLSRARSVLHPLPPQSVIWKSAERLYSVVTTRNTRMSIETEMERDARIRRTDEELPGIAQDLSKLILTPVWNDVKTSRIAVAGDGPLWRLPFGILAMPSARDEYVPLLDQHEIVALPSASLLRQLRQRAARASRLITVLADPVFSTTDERFGYRAPDRSNARINEQVIVRMRRLARSLPQQSPSVELPRLPGTRDEAIGISSLLRPRKDVVVSLDFEARLSTVLSPKVTDCQIVHFATHGILDESRPDLSGLALSLVDQQGQPIPGFLNTGHVRSCPLNAELAVLSACRTGLGKENVSDGILGLPRAFMFAGVPRVIATMWGIDDAATAAIMSAFYRELFSSSQAAPAQAMRKAQLEVRNHDDWHSPYYWGGFSLFGDWHAFSILPEIGFHPDAASH